MRGRSTAWNSCSLFPPTTAAAMLTTARRPAKGNAHCLFALAADVILRAFLWSRSPPGTATCKHARQVIMNGPLFTGSITALITPFRKGGAIDEDAFRHFVKWQIDEGTDALVPMGTTGESPTVTHDEHKRVIELCIEAAEGRVPVIAGAGSNSTAEAIDFMKHAEAVGADAGLVVTPYYNKPNREGLYQHFKAVQDATSLPIIIYNIPCRSVVDMTVE